jgi:hypothetical protein
MIHSPGLLTTVNPGGNNSVTVALAADPGPKLTTVSVYVIVVPRGTVVLRDFKIATSGSAQTVDGK